MQDERNSATVGLIIRLRDLEDLAELRRFITEKLGAEILFKNIARPGEYLRIVWEPMEARP